MSTKVYWNLSLLNYPNQLKYSDRFTTHPVYITLTRSTSSLLYRHSNSSRVLVHFLSRRSTAISLPVTISFLTSNLNFCSIDHCITSRNVAILQNISFVNSLSRIFNFWAISSVEIYSIRIGDNFSSRKGSNNLRNQRGKSSLGINLKKTNASPNFPFYTMLARTLGVNQIFLPYIRTLKWRYPRSIK